jgi:hypothetical protein
MKKVVFAALAIIGTQFAATAQETAATEAASDTIRSTQSWYVGFGATGFDKFKINDNLKAAGMPQLGDVAFQVSIGRESIGEDFLTNLEWNTAYMDEKTSTDRVRTVNTGIKLRFHYIPWQNKKFFLSTGADFAYTFNNFNLYTRGNEINLDDLDPGTHTGHISLYNNQLTLGPSIMFGAFNNTNFPVRLVAGYDWAVYSSKWKSEFANVSNSFRESGQGSWYARLVLPL